VPLLLIPIGGDDRFNAAKVVDAGAGLALGLPGRFTVALSPATRPFDAAAVHAAARELLTDPSYREAAGRLRAEAEALPDLDHAAGLLARLAAERRPEPAARR
jgi:UDP:flavonoid glycosyltransferase YjiC (YdhE family)